MLRSVAELITFDRNNRKSCNLEHKRDTLLMSITYKHYLQNLSF
jgi:hypothetical protein